MTVHVENNGRTLGGVDEGRFVTGKSTGALRGAPTVQTREE